MSETATVVTRGIHHVGLTVRDLEETAGFFIEVMGFRKLRENPAYPALFITDGSNMLSLWRASDPAGAKPFERKNTLGLHHLAFEVAPNDLDALHDRLSQTAGVTIEFAPEPVGEGPARHMMCVIPGGIRVEFIAPVTV